MTKRIIALAVAQSFGIGWVLHFVYLPEAAPAGHHGAAATDPLTHYLRDSALATPVAVVVVALTVLLVRRLRTRSAVVFAAAVALASAAAAVPEVFAHGLLFDEHVDGVSLGEHVTGVGLVTVRYTFALAIGWALLFGVPWRAVTSDQTSDQATVGEPTQ